MKPKKLVFSGVNCYDCEQVINFDKLSKSGIFGIFGATGSGKSTILDCITLALFGEIGRSRVKGDFINTKSQKASVRLEFCVKKEYAVERSYKVKKSGAIESDAVLYCGDSVVAEGARAVNEKLQEITGLTFADFSKCVALPQGEFAAFLKAKPAERVALVGNLFNLERYGDELLRKANLKRDLLQQELNQISSQVSSLGEDLPAKIKDIESGIELLKQNLQLSASEKEQLQQAAVKQQAAKEQLQQYQELKSQKIELENRSAEINKKRVQLEQHKSVSVHAGSIDRYIKLKEVIQEQETGLDGIRKEYFMLQNQLNDVLGRQKENLKRQDTLPNSENILLELVALKQQLSTNKELKEEVKRVKEKIELQIKEQQKVEAEQENIVFGLKDLEEDIKEINGKIAKQEGILESLKKQEANTDAVGRRSAFLEVLEKLKYHFDNIEEKNAIGLKEIDKRNKMCNKNDLQVHQLLVKLGFDDDYQKAENELCDSIDKMEHAKAHVNMLLEQIEDCKSCINQQEANDNFADAELEKCSQDRYTLDSSKNSLKDRLKSLEQERDNALLDNAERTVSSETVIGAECPICGNIVSHVYAPKNTAISNLNNAILLVKKQIEHLDLELMQLEVRKTKIEQQKEARKTICQQKYKDIKQLENSINKVLISFVDIGENAQEAFDKKLEAAKFKLDSLEKIREKLVHLAQHTKTLKEQNEQVGSGLVCYQEVKEFLYGYIQQVQKVLAEDKIEQLSLPVKNIEEIKREKEKVMHALTESKNLLAKKEKEKVALSSVLSAQGVKLGLIKQQIEEQSAPLAKKEESILLLEKKAEELSKGFKSVDDRIEKIKSAKDSIQKESRDIATELASLTSRFESCKVKKVALEEKIKSGSEELKHIEDTLNGLLVSYKVKSIEQLLAMVLTNSDVLSSEVSSYDNQCLVVNERLQALGDMQGVKVDSGLPQKLKDCEEKLSAMQTELGAKVEQLKTINRDLALQKELLKTRVLVEENYNNFYELSSLLRGKELLAFAAEEYLVEICSVASSKLFELYDGRYTLVYQDKDFYVKDHFDGGALRSTTTLSGGETFVVSLALALSIAESILRLSNRSIDFFFLDEGFGTLDQELRETIMNALIKLKNSGITIGLITHMQELKNDINSRIVVKREANKDGSYKSVITFEQDI